MDFQPGDVFAGHRIEGVAGRGGMGVVYRATQLALERTVALKTIAPALAADTSFRARFVRESKAAAAIDHPNVLPIFSAGEEDDVLFISMRYVDGPDLRSLIRYEGRLAPERATALVAQVAAALDAAHERGLIHRDVKPANVLLDHAEHAYLTDFGLTKRMQESATAATHPGGWVGTLGYVAPEQIRDAGVDGRTDVYALGCVLYHALSGAPPFERSSDEATLFAHLQDQPPPLPEGAPERLGDVLAAALAKNPDDRYETAGAFGRAMLAAVGRPVTEVAGLERVRTPAPAADETRVTPPAELPGGAGGGGGGETEVTRRAREAAAPRRRGRRLAVAALALVLLAGGGAAAAVLGVGGDDAKDGSTRAAPAPPPEPGGVEVGLLPTGVAVARGNAYVALPRSDRLVSVDLARFDRRRRAFAIGRGSTALEAGFGALWSTRQLDGVETVRRTDLSSGEGVEQTLPDGTPVAVAAGERAVWVGMRGAQFAPTPPSSVVRLDPETGQITTSITLHREVMDMAVGYGAVWITNRRNSVLRIDSRTGEQRAIRVGRGPTGIAVGGGAVWSANTAEGTISRIDARETRRVRTTEVAGQPRGLAYGGGRLWIAGFTSDKVTSLDGETGDVAGEVPVSANPTKLVATRDAVLVLARGADRLERIPFE